MLEIIVFISIQAQVAKEMSKHSAECQRLRAGVCSVICQQLTCLNSSFRGRPAVAFLFLTHSYVTQALSLCSAIVFSFSLI